MIDEAKMGGMTPDVLIFKRQVGALSAVHAPSDHAFGVLDRNAPLSLFDEDNDPHHGDHEHQQNQYHEDGDLTGGQQPKRIGHRGGQTNDDTGENNQRNAVADSPFGNLFAQPHDKGRTGGQGDDGHDAEFPPGMDHDGGPARSAHTLESDTDPKPLDNTQQNGTVTVYWVIFLRPCSPSLDNRSRCGTTTVSNCRMIEALM